MPLREVSSGRIFVVGSFVTGVTIRVSRQPVPGETLMGCDFNLGPGGKGFNQAVAASRAGAVVSIILCTGNDMFSQMAEVALQKENISTDLLFKIEQVNTGCGMVTLLDSGENSIIIDMGANAKLSAEMINRSAGLIAESKIVMAQLEVPDEAVERAFSLAKQYGRITMLNPAPARSLSPVIIENTDILTPNETEAKVLLGIRPELQVPVTELAHGLRAMGVKMVVLTRGKSGALIITEEEIIDIPAPRIKPVDSTGAGDCFSGNLACALVKGIPIKEAVTRAVFAGAYSTQYLGVIDGLPHANQLESYMKQHSDVVNII